MKKRNILTMALALVLVVVLAVGGTLAYLTDTDEKVENSFTFADGMKVTITEPTPTSEKDETITPKDPKNPGKGFNYDNVVPGQNVKKAPTIGTTTEVDAYVFVKISGASDYAQPVGITNGWTAIVDGTATTHYNGVYYKAVEGGADMQDLKAIFEQVKIGEATITEGTTAPTIDDIMIEVYEIQQAAFDDVNAALAQTPFAPAA